MRGGDDRENCALKEEISAQAQEISALKQLRRDDAATLQLNDAIARLSSRQINHCQNIRVQVE